MYYNIERDVYQTLHDSTLKIIKDNSSSDMNQMYPVKDESNDSHDTTAKNNNSKNTNTAKADPLKFIALHILSQTMCKYGATSTEGLNYFLKEIQKHEKASE